VELIVIKKGRALPDLQTPKPLQCVIKISCQNKNAPVETVGLLRFECDKSTAGEASVLRYDSVKVMGRRITSYREITV
jgi:hypothetical protein